MEKQVHDIKNLLLRPVETFKALKTDSVSKSELTKSLLLYLAAIPAIAGFLGKVVIGTSVPFYGYYRVSFFSGLWHAVLLFIFAVLGIYILSFITHKLSPKFGGIDDDLSAFKLIVMSYVPLFILGVSSLIPALSGLYILGLYGIYLFYVGVPVMMECSEEKALPFTVVISLISIVLTVLFYRIAALAIVNSVPNL